MKKDSIQTRKRKPKGQGKGKGAKAQKTKATVEKEETKSKVADPAYPAPNYSSFIGTSIPTDLSLGPVIDVSNLPSSFEKPLESNSIQKPSSDPSKSSSSTTAGYVDSPTYPGSPTVPGADGEQKTAEMCPSSQPQHYSPLSQCLPDSNNSDLITSKSELIPGEGLHQVTSTYLNYTNLSNQKHLNLINVSDKSDFGAAAQPVLLNRVSNEAIDTTGSFNAGLTTMYSGSDASETSIGDGQYHRHFPHYQPYQNFADYRSSALVKSEPTVN